MRKVIAEDLRGIQFGEFSHMHDMLSLMCFACFDAG